MRQLHVHVPEAAADTVLRLAEAHESFAAAAVPARRRSGDERVVILLQIPNQRVGSFLEAVEDEVESAEFVLFPRGTLPIETPLSTIQEARDVSPISTAELVVSALQSVGSWRGMLLYALFSGLVAAYGVVFDVAYLLVAAMLIAPMGAPAMVAAAGVALGETTMLRRGAVRFVVAVVVLAAAAWLLGVALGIESSSATMELVSSLSIWTVMLAVVGGAAGAQALVQSDRDSLVTATATGFLVAVSLSPPAAVLGLAAALGRWDYAAQMTYIIVLTFVGVLLGSWITFTLFSVGPGDMSAGRGSARRRSLLVGATAVALLALVGWQSTRGASFHKADRSREAATLTRQAVRSTPGVALVAASAHFTRTDLEGVSGEGLRIIVVADRTAPGTPTDSLEARVRSAVHARLAGMEDVVPFVQVTVLPGTPRR